MVRETASAGSAAAAAPENPTSDVAAYKNPFPPDRVVLSLAALVYMLLFVLFWPQSYTTMDEADYMGMAYVYRQGTFYPDVAGVQVITAFPVGEHLVSKYPPGQPALLAAFSLFGWPAALAANLIVHLLTFYVVALTLRRLNVPVAFALLYLFHPTAVIYSRTAMADMPTGLCIATAFYLLLQRRYALCGLAAGLSLLFRNANAVALPLFAVGCFFDVIHSKGAVGAGIREQFSPLAPRVKQAALFVLGALPGLVALAYYTNAVQGGGGLTKYGGSFGLSHFPSMFGTYIARLSILYPLMVFAPAAYRGAGRLTLMGLTYSFVLLYSFWYFADSTGSGLESFVIGLRFMLAVLPLFIVAYAWVVWDFASRRLRLSPRVVTALSGAAALLLIVIAAGIHFMHDRKLDEMTMARAAILQIVRPGEKLVCNMPVAKLFHPGWGKRDFFMVGMNDENNRRIAAEKFREGLKNGNGAVLAMWVRGYRAEAASEQKFIDDMAERFVLKPLTGEERRGLPAEVQVFRIAGERNGARVTGNGVSPPSAFRTPQ